MAGEDKMLAVFAWTYFGCGLCCMESIILDVVGKERLHWNNGKSALADKVWRKPFDLWLSIPVMTAIGIFLVTSLPGGRVQEVVHHLKGDKYLPVIKQFSFHGR
jgi:hypothetical protein